MQHWRALTIASSSEESAIRCLLNGPLYFNPTVFPRRAAYTTLISSGGLAAITSGISPWP